MAQLKGGVLQVLRRFAVLVASGVLAVTFAAPAVAKKPVSPPDQQNCIERFDPRVGGYTLVTTGCPVV